MLYRTYLKDCIAVKFCSFKRQGRSLGTRETGKLLTQVLSIRLQWASVYLVRFFCVQPTLVLGKHWRCWGFFILLKYLDFTFIFNSSRTASLCFMLEYFAYIGFLVQKVYRITKMCIRFQKSTIHMSRVYFWIIEECCTDPTSYV